VLDEDSEQVKCYHWCADTTILLPSYIFLTRPWGLAW